ncbi:MAG: ATP synthase F1 subunit delta [Saprospiraceae bacterium]|nr:ATP synthase F1 subunit delta [Saprospiraceae bacterium]
MSAHRIASRYAKSLLDLAIDRNQLDAVLADMMHVQEALKVRDLLLMIKSPIINPGKKKGIFHRVFANKLSKSTQAFFDIMIRKGRESLLPEIVDSFVEQYKEFKNISTIIIKTAVPLDDGTINSIRQKLIAAKIAKENLEVQVEVDPELVGGFTLAFEGKQYDASLATKLKELRKQFAN